MSPERNRNKQGNQSFNFILISLLFILSTVQGCSLASYGTQESILGSIAGAIGGTGIGYIIGDEYGKKTENMAIAGGIGAASGLALGALVHDNRAKFAQEGAQIVRQAKHISDRQKEIDILREDTYSESSWGKLDIKPWHERYEVETSEMPYQGLPLN